MTMSRKYTTFLWFLLIVMFKDVVRAGAKGENNKLMTKLPKITKSIFINGGRVNWNDWAPNNIENENFVGNDKDAKTMVTFVKCEIACFIHTFIDSIIPSLIPCSDNPIPKYKDVMECLRNNHDVIKKLKLLNENIILAIDRLLRLVHQYPNLRSIESHFTSSLLEAYFYIESLADLEKLINFNERFNIQTAFSILKSIDRSLLQIMNLNGHFGLEYCYPNEDNENGVDLRDQYAKLKDFLKGNDSPDTRSSESLFNRETIILKKCMVNNNVDETTDRGLNFCIKFVKTAKIGKKVINNKHENFKTMDVLFDNVFKCSPYNFLNIYEYMLDIYHVILKLIYLQTQKEWLSLDETWCQEIITKLKSKNCPIGIIEHFNILLHFTRYRGEFKDERSKKNITMVFKNKCYDIKHVAIEDTNISFSDLMIIILDSEIFEQFWRVLNFLYKDFAKKSAMTYDVSLNFLYGPKAYVKDFKKRSKTESYDSLNSFDLDTIIYNPLTELVDEYLSETLPQKRNSLDILFKELENVIKTPELDKNLKKIYLTARIQLENLNELQFENFEILMRKVNLILNMVDNYIIQLFEYSSLQNRKFAFKNKYDINKINNQKQKKRTNEGQSAKHSNTCFHLPNLNSKKTYDFNKLTGKEVIENGSLGTKVSFDWQGETKNIVKIQSDLSTTMLNIQDLVDYQRLCFKMLLYVFFESWLVIFEKTFKNLETIQKEKYEESLAALSKTSSDLLLIPDNPMDISISNFIPLRMFGTYKDYFTPKLYNYSIIRLNPGPCDGNKLFEVFKNDIIGQIVELLGIDVSDNPDIGDIQNFLSIKSNKWNKLSVISKGKYSLLYEKANNIINKFIDNFLNIDVEFLPDFEYEPYSRMVFTF